MVTADRQRYDHSRYLRAKAKRVASGEPDLIEMLTLEERAYIAGLVDGDGTIYIMSSNRPKRQTVYPAVVIAMTHRGVIDWLADRLGMRVAHLRARNDEGHLARLSRMHNQTGRRLNPTLKPQFAFRLYGRRAQLLCSVMLPYLRVKGEQARLVTLFACDLRTAPGVRIAEGANIERLALRDKVNSLNH